MSSGRRGWSGCARTSGCACCRPPRRCRTRRRGRWRGMLRGLPGDYLRGVRGAADSGGVVHRPGLPCRDGVRGVRVHRGRADRRVRAQPRGRDHYVRHGRPKTCWLCELAPGGLAALAGRVRCPGADRPPRPGLQRPRRRRRGRAAGLPGQVADHRKPKGSAARSGGDPGGDRGGPAVRRELGVRGRAVRQHHAAGGAAPLRDPVQPPAGPVRAAQPQDDQAGSAGRRRRRPPTSRCAPGCGPRPPPGG